VVCHKSFVGNATIDSHSGPMHQWLVLVVVLLMLGDPLPENVEASSRASASQPGVGRMRWGMAAAAKAEWRGTKEIGKQPAVGGAGRLRVGMLAQGVFWKGLFRDVEIVTWGGHC